MRATVAMIVSRISAASRSCSSWEREATGVPASMRASSARHGQRSLLPTKRASARSASASAPNVASAAERLLHQLGGALARGLEAEDRREGGLAPGAVAAGALAGRRRVPLDVQEVVDDLEAEPDAPRVLGEGLEARRRRAGGDGAAAHAREDQGAGLARVDELQLRQRQLAPLRLEVRHLPADEPRGAAGRRDLAHDRHAPLRRNRAVGGEHLEGHA